MESVSPFPNIVDLVSAVQFDDIAACVVIAVFSAVFLLRGIAWDKPDPYHHVWFERPQEKLSGDRVKETRHIATKMRESGKSIVVFFGSQSGTAESFANRLAREIHVRFGVGTLSADLSDFDSHSIAELQTDNLAIFILSTFGEGDPSDNTAGLWEWLTKPAGTITVPNLQFVSFGLGNSNYKYYNRVVDVVCEKLLAGGAKCLLPIGRADDAHGGTEEDFMDWKEGLFDLLQDRLGYQQHDVIYEPGIKVVEDESFAPIDLHHGEPIPHGSTSLESAIKPLPIVQSRELFSSSSRNCLHLELDISAFPDIKYRTGDHLIIWPSNTDGEVNRLLSTLGLFGRADTPISISALDQATKLSIPTPTTIQALFRHYLEIGSPVSRDTITALSQFAPSAEAQEFLLRLGKHKKAYADYILGNHVTIASLLYSASGSLPWNAVPLSLLIENIPPMRPRYYSISSSAVVQARQLAITAVMDVKKVGSDGDDQILGLTSHYLYAHNIQLSKGVAMPGHPTYSLNGPGGSLSGGKIFAQIRKSKFKLPFNATHPIIMVAAGTGIAPFRGFLQERARLRSMGREVGKMLLFFGCRLAKEEYLYRQELEEFELIFEGGLEIITAFSRDGSRKIYVQDRIEERASDVISLLQADATFYICGSANMAREVAGRVGEAVKKSNGWNDVDLRSWTERAKRTNKWQEDVWG